MFVLELFKFNDPPKFFENVFINEQFYKFMLELKFLNEIDPPCY
jgi:hypothetical protein